MNIHEEQMIVAKAMIEHGGGFVERLGKALEYADQENTWIIKASWPTYWKKYLIMGQKDR